MSAESSLNPIQGLDIVESPSPAEVDPFSKLERLLGSGAPWARFGDFMAASRLLRGIPVGTREDRAVATVRVALLGNCMLGYLGDAIELALAPRLACAIHVAEFDQWPQELLSPGSALAGFRPDVVLFHLSSLGLTAGGTRLGPVPVPEIVEALRGFGARSPARVIAVLPEPLAEGTGLDTDADRWHRAARREVADAVAEALPGRSVAFDPAPALSSLGGAWPAPRYWGSAKVPMHPTACVELGRRLARVVENLTFPRVKVVAIDCDNTLWGGEVGEVGPEGLSLSPHDDGAGYLRLQRLLKEASRRGILLIAVSKNEPESVDAVFERRPEMILARDDFAAFKVGWGPKSQALREAAAELRLGLDSFLFLDDSPFERGEVRAALPEVLVVDLPPSPDDYAGAVARMGLLERPIVSEEDLRRGSLYRLERAREQARGSASSHEDYLRSLGLELHARAVGPGDLDRVAQLVAKTNQFNLTSLRHGRERLAALAADPEVYAHAFRVVDRFGDSGFVGVGIARPDGEGTARIDTFLMSCRVMGRTVEAAMFEHLRAWLAARGYSRLRGEYVPTRKNKPVADLLPRFGFVPEDGDPGRHFYLLEGLGRPIENEYVAILGD